MVATGDFPRFEILRAQIGFNSLDSLVTAFLEHRGPSWKQADVKNSGHEKEGYKIGARVEETPPSRKSIVISAQWLFPTGNREFLVESRKIIVITYIKIDSKRGNLFAICPTDSVQYQKIGGEIWGYLEQSLDVSETSPEAPPQKPTNKTDVYLWLDYYHACKKAGVKYTLKDVSKDVDLSHGYIRQLNQGYSPRPYKN